MHHDLARFKGFDISRFFGSCTSIGYLMRFEDECLKTIIKMECCINTFGGVVLGQFYTSNGLKISVVDS